MAINYPLALPTVTGVRSIELQATNAVAVSRSPFTFASQVHAYSGQMWSASLTLPPMHRSKSETWIAFLMSLRGQYGTFLLGDPRGSVSRGLASNFAGAPTVTAQTGSTINVTGASANKAGWLLAGDYIQIGENASATLHKVLQDANTSASGGVTLEVWPALRGSRTGVVSVTNAQGVFRLASNDFAWSVDEASIYGISFSAVEKI
jgi:hypothetical protein